jgi:hypothetical protein
VRWQPTFGPRGPQSRLVSRSRACSSPDRAFGSGPKGSRFDSCQAHSYTDLYHPRQLAPSAGTVGDLRVFYRRTVVGVIQTMLAENFTGTRDTSDPTHQPPTGGGVKFLQPSAIQEMAGDLARTPDLPLGSEPDKEADEGDDACPDQDVSPTHSVASEDRSTWGKPTIRLTRVQTC